MKDKRIYWALYLFIISILFLLNSLEVFPVKLEILNLIIITLMGCIMIANIFELNFYGILFSLSVILIIIIEEFDLFSIDKILLLVFTVISSYALDATFKRKL